VQIQTTGVVLLTVISRLFQTFVLLVVVVSPPKNAVQSRPTSTVAVMMLMYSDKELCIIMYLVPAVSIDCVWFSVHCTHCMFY
jgi:hypothetical protein